MSLYLYELSYTAESLAAQIKNPQDRIPAVAKPILDKIGGTLVGGGYSLGDADVVILIDVPDDVSAAAVAVAVSAGGAVTSSKTTKLLSGDEWVSALTKAGDIAGVYTPAR